MTGTDKKVVRRTVVDTIHTKGKHRRIIAILGGGKDPDLIRFKLEGLPSTTDGVTLKEIFWMDYKRTIMRKWNAENERRKALGKRKLKRPSLT